MVIEKLSEMLDATDNTYAQKLTTLLDEAGRIFISGAGRSRLVGNFLGMRLMHCGYDVAIVGEIVTPSVKLGDLLVVISGSGETEQLIAFTKKAKEIGAKVVLISSRAKSTIGDLAEAVFQIGKQELYQKVKGMPMGTVFELSTLCFLEALISNIVWEKGIPEEKMREMCVFHAIRPPIPRASGHPIHTDSATQSTAIRPFGQAVGAKRR